METGLHDIKGRKGSIPLKDVSVSGSVLGNFADITVRQVYINDTMDNIEAVYTFPLPDTASVYSLEALLGDRRIKGEVMEKELAFKRYDNAVVKGDSAFLLEQYRPNVFQMSIGQIKPGDRAEIAISYVDELKEDDSEARLTIPTVTAPRYIPGKPGGTHKGPGLADPTGRVPDADFITPPIGDTGCSISFRLEVRALRLVSSYQSPSHNIKVEQQDGGAAVIRLDGTAASMDRDFVLVMKLREEPSSYAVTGTDDRGESYIYAAFVPEICIEPSNARREYIFLIDISGSMDGSKLEQAKNALKICLRNLSEGDCFNMTAFESSCHYFSRHAAVPFNQKTLEAASAWVDALYAMGGTEILEAVSFGLQDQKRDRTVLLFTDGQVGNEREVLRFVQQNRERARIFPFGIDTAVNAYFINSIADAGEGKAEFVYPGERIDDKVIRQFSRIISPAAGDIAIDWGGLKTEGIIPERIKSLFDMEYVSIAAKYTGELTGEPRLRGKVDGTELYFTVDRGSISAMDGNLIARLWARGRIRALETAIGSGNPRREETLKEEIGKVSAKYGVLSSQTSFVAVAEREDKASGLPETVVVPVMLPSQWEMPLPPRVYASPPSRGVMKQSFMRTSFSVMEQDVQACFNRPDSLMPGAANPLSGGQPNGVGKPDRVGNPDMDGFKAASQASDDPRVLLRFLAASQRADGAFSDKGQGGLLQDALTSASVLAAFSLSDCGIQMYRRQLEKCISRLGEFYEALKGKPDDSCLFCQVLLLALKSCILRGVPGPAGMGKTRELLYEAEAVMASKGMLSPEAVALLGCADLNALRGNRDLILWALGSHPEGEWLQPVEMPDKPMEGLKISVAARQCIFKAI